MISRAAISPLAPIPIVGDHKIAANHSGTGVATFYQADIVSVSVPIMSGYPFGMFPKTTNLRFGRFSNAALAVEIKERSWSVSSYRFGFNGKEKDSETFDGAIAFEARIYDSRIGRFFSSDPREAEYAWQSTYAYFSNCPIAIIDHLGMGGDGDTEKGRPVEKGESPYNYAKTHNISLAELAKLNPDKFTGDVSAENYWTEGKGKLWNINEGDRLNVTSKKPLVNVEANPLSNKSKPVELKNNNTTTISLPTAIGLGKELVEKGGKKGLETLNKVHLEQVKLNNSIRKQGVELLDESPIKIPSSMKLISKAGGTMLVVWSLADNRSQFKSGELNKVQYYAENTSTGIGAIPGIGFFWSVGWETGRLITNTQTYQSFKSSLFSTTPVCLTCEALKNKK